MKLLNLGCGTKTSSIPGVINVDWSPLLRLKKMKFGNALARLTLRGDRLHRFLSLPENIEVCDFSRGLPFPDDSVDYVYHSHMLEHLDRDIAENFLREVWRVLRRGGVQRIVVPDLEGLCRAYMRHIEEAQLSPAEADRHDEYVSALIEQCVRKEATGTKAQAPFRRYLENLLLGDARQRGETHQWMYDRVNLSSKLTSLRFGAIRTRPFDESAIPEWNDIGLDVGTNGGEYKPGSLYLESAK